MKALIKNMAVATGILLLFSATKKNITADDWKAPAEADKLFNPLKGNAAECYWKKFGYVRCTAPSGTTQRITKSSNKSFTAVNIIAVLLFASLILMSIVKYY